MKYTRTERINAATANEAAHFEVHPDARSASMSVAVDVGSWGTAVVTVEVSVDGRFWKTARTYLDRAVSTISANTNVQRIDLRAAKFIRARVSTVGSAGTYLRVQCTMTEGKPSERYVSPLHIPVMFGQSATTDAQTVYCGSAPRLLTTVALANKTYFPRAGTITRISIATYAITAGTNESWTCYFRLNDTTDTTIATISAATNERHFLLDPASIAVVKGDFFEIKFVNPTWVTNPNNVVMGGHVYLE
jgi:hypothetical protein